MTTARRFRNTWLGACALSLLTVQCGGTATPAVQNNNVAAVAAPTPRAAAPDTSEVAAPDGLIAVVRIAPITPLIERIGQLTGLGGQLRGVVDEAFRAAPGHPALGALADRNLPIDVIVVAKADGTPDAAFAFGAASLEQVEQAVERSHRMVALGNGVQRFERVQQEQTPRRRRRQMEEDDAGTDRMHCVAAPTPRASESRVVCAESMATVESVVAYASRTLTRREVPAHSVVAEVAADELRRRFGADARRDLDAARREVLEELNTSTIVPWNDATVRQLTARIVGELFDNVRSVVDEGAGLRGSLTFHEDRITGLMGADLRQPQGTLIRALAEGTRGQPQVPAELLTHLLPGGMVYVAGALDARPVRAFTTQLLDLAAQIARLERTLSAADQTALRAALEAAAMLDQSAFAVSVGYDDRGNPWGAGTARLGTAQPAQVVAAYRTIVTTLRRPAVQRLINATMGPDFTREITLRELRELPTAGLPAGAFAVSLPTVSMQNTGGIIGSIFGARTPVAPPPAVRRGGRPVPAPRAPAAPRMAALQVIFVPSGQDIVMAFGPDARGVLTRYQANTTPGVDAARLRAEGSSLVYALVPAGIPNSLRAAMPAEATTIATTIAQMQDQGRTPVLFRMGSTESEGLTRFALEGEVSSATLSILRSLANALNGP